MSPRVKKTQVGNRLKQARLKAGYETQKDLADALGFVSQSQLSRWESDGWVPTEKVDDVAEALDVSVQWLRDEQPEDVDDGRDYVSSAEDVTAWRDAVIAEYGAGDPLCRILVSIPMAPFLQTPDEAGEGPGQWLVMTTVGEFVEEVRIDRETVEEECDRLLECPYLERVGEPVEWAFRLRFPDSSSESD